MCGFEYSNETCTAVVPTGGSSTFAFAPGGGVGRCMLLLLFLNHELVVRSVWGHWEKANQTAVKAKSTLKARKYETESRSILSDSSHPGHRGLVLEVQRSTKKRTRVSSLS